MGLDQSLYIVDLSKEDATPRYEIMYFRKFNALQGWMEDLYRSKGGTEEFNCVAVELTVEDLDRLLDDLNNNRLEPRSGFFFGSDEINGYHMRDTYNALEFIKTLRKMGINFKVFYDSWW